MRKVLSPSLLAPPKGTLLTSTLGLAAFAGGLLTQAAAAEPVAPNIIVIMADDAGYYDFGFQGNEAFREITPNLDRLAERSTRFTQAYASATVCGPSRAGFITGKYQQRYGFQENFPSHWGDNPHPSWRTDAWKNFGLDPSATTMADYLQSVGYRTGLIGKWHLGYAPRFHPNLRGFEYFFGFLSGGRNYFPNPYYNETDNIPRQWNSLEENGERIPESEVTYLTEDLTRIALKFIEESAALDRPYFLFLSHFAPHTPMQATEEDLAITRQLFPEANLRRQTYAAMMLNLDRGIGEVMNKIEALGQTENTLIVFVSDNGGPRNNGSDNFPLRGHKYTPYEGGTRVPLLLSWPGVLPEGKVFEPVVSLLDLLPTFLEAARHEPVEGMDGLSLFPWLRSGDLTEFPNRDLFWRENTFYAGTEWIRSREAEKAIWFRGNPWGTPRPEHSPFFDLARDPSEANDLGPVSQDRVKELRERWEAWSNGLASPRW
jgi:arylsulfatase A-like enzyme